MKRSKIFSAPLLLIGIIALLISYTPSVEARKHQTKKSKPHHHHKGKGGSGNNTPHPPSTIFPIFHFGAKGDGLSDDSKALLEAWQAACKVKGATVQIPSGFKFLINPITLNGISCMPDLVLQIDGTLLAPPQAGWQNTSLLQWINFKYTHNFTIRGAGIVDGQGVRWWNNNSTPAYYLQKKYSKHISDIKPTVMALRFFSGSNVMVRDIKIINSPRCHLKFDNSLWIKVESISIFSPEDSPNTDGIHLQNTQNVEIHHSNISCGDDCVSIQRGCSNIHVHHIHCGPGHGISVGGLGENESTVACVSNVIVNDISFQNTQSGVRIKTWPGGKGLVKNVSFSNIQVSNVSTPIVIDQNYCDKTKLSCKNQKRGAVAISGVKYDRIIGTYSWQPILLACSNDSPCTDVDLIDIQLAPPPGQRRTLEQAQCFNSFGKSKGPILVPAASTNSCLRREGGPLKRLTKSHEHNHMC